MSVVLESGKLGISVAVHCWVYWLAAIKHESDVEVGIAVVDGHQVLPYLYIELHLLEQFAMECLLGSLAGFYLTTGKLPVVRCIVVLGETALHTQDFTIVLNNCCDYLHTYYIYYLARLILKLRP